MAFFNLHLPHNPSSSPQWHNPSSSFKVRWFKKIINFHVCLWCLMIFIFILGEFRIFLCMTMKFRLLKQITLYLICRTQTKLIFMLTMMMMMLIKCENLWVVVHLYPSQPTRPNRVSTYRTPAITVNSNGREWAIVYHSRLTFGLRFPNRNPTVPDRCPPLVKHNLVLVVLLIIYLLKPILGTNNFLC